MLKPLINFVFRVLTLLLIYKINACIKALNTSMFVTTRFGFGFVGIIMIFSAYVGLFLERGHLIIVLLLFERVMLGLFFFLLADLLLFFTGFYLSLVLIRFGACEAAVGLALLVSLIRSHGTDFVSVLTIYEC